MSFRMSQVTTSRLGSISPPRSNVSATSWPSRRPFDVRESPATTSYTRNDGPGVGVGTVRLGLTDDEAEGLTDAAVEIGGADAEGGNVVGLGDGVGPREHAASTIEASRAPRRGKR